MGTAPVPPPALVPGSLVVLDCPPPLCPHVEFAAAAVLQRTVSLSWTGQPARPGNLYAATDFRATSGTAGALAARLRTLGAVAFETVEGPAPGVDAERYTFTPALGLHRAAIGANGDIVVGEQQLRALLERADGPLALAHGLERLLGTAWDDELEALRAGGDGATVTWLRSTG